MAETVSIVAEKLSNLVFQEASLFGEVEGQIKLLRDELKWMHLFLKDLDSQSINNARIKLWVEQIRDVSFDAEDAIDEFIFKMDHPRQQRLIALKFLKCLPTCVSFALKLPFVHELDGRVKEINARIEKIMANRSKYGLEDLIGSSTSSSEVVLRKEVMRPVVEETDIVGIEDDLKYVMGMLIKEETRAVVSIVGMGGLGKTTLAKRVYNHPEIQRHFACRAWVSVSQEYRIRELLMEIVNCVQITLKEEEKGKMMESELGSKLQKHLESNKYLIVLDDVWSSNVWNKMKSYFPESNKSRVLITTRDKEIALEVSPHFCELRHLNRTESWDLFVRRTFHGENCPPELVVLGTKIVERCGGLPLAIVVMGGLLSWKEKTEESWKKVFDSMEWLLNRGPNSCMEILALSYNNLPYYLKPCFLYCGIFPEDCEIRATQLMRMWIAEGFIQARGEEKLEDIAEDYLEELIHKSMIQVAQRRLDGGVKSCRMHDLVRDLAISTAKESKFFEVCRKTYSYSTSPITARRLTFHGQLVQNTSHSPPHTWRVRSLISFARRFEETIFKSLVKDLKLLTVLNLEGEEGIESLPTEIGGLIHLKYLCLRDSGITRLPGSIGRLVNLQTLDLRDCYLDGSFPSSIWKLHQLRHLSGCHYDWRAFMRDSCRCRCRWMNVDMAVHQLSNLQKLTFCTSLLFARLEVGCLQKLSQLTTLSIVGRLHKLPDMYPPNLVKLKLVKSHLPKDPMLTLHKLPNLRVLKLKYAYDGKRMVFSSTGFPRLQFLGLNTLYFLEELQAEEGAVPLLRTLHIQACYGMNKFPTGLLTLKNLERLELISMPGRLNEEINGAQGNDWDKIRRITRVE